MHRLFVAFRPPTPIIAALRLAVGDVAGARWQNEDQLHLTLRYIGEVDRRAAEDVAQMLDALSFAAFPVTLSGVGHFDSKAEGHPLWAGVAPFEPLHALHKKIDHALVRAGQPSEQRAYRPHITLARLGRNAGNPDAWLAGHFGLSSEPFLLDHISLFESLLTKDGAHYREITRIKAER